MSSNCPKCGQPTNDKYFDGKGKVFSNWMCKDCFELNKNKKEEVKNTSERQTLRSNNNFKSKSGGQE